MRGPIATAAAAAKASAPRARPARPKRPAVLVVNGILLSLAIGSSAVVPTRGYGPRGGILSPATAAGNRERSDVEARVAAAAL